MKKALEPAELPDGCLLITCSSHEERCLALPRRWAKWRPRKVILFNYTDQNVRRDKNAAELRRMYDAGATLMEVGFNESNAVESFHQNRTVLLETIRELPRPEIVLDLSVFTKRHLLMILRWLDDEGCWPRLWATYTEPEKYDVTGYVPLSFGVARVEEVPGFSAAPDTSRPLHVVIFLGFEGDRTLATYEILQPSQTTLVIPDPPYREEWRGMTEELNKDLISIVGGGGSIRVDALDPSASLDALRRVLGDEATRSEFARVVCPLGTKPQTLGAYLYARVASDPPAIVYTGPLRHNHAHFSHGIGKSWVVLKP